MYGGNRNELDQMTVLMVLIMHNYSIADHQISQFIQSRHVISAEEKPNVFAVCEYIARGGNPQCA